MDPRVESKWRLGWVHLLAIALMAGVLLTRVPRVSAQSVVPHTVTLQETTTKPDGAVAAAPTYTFALRSDGATAFVTNRVTGDPTFASRILRFPTGQRVSIQDQRALKSTTPSNWTLGNLRYAASNCLLPGSSEVAAGTEKVSGYLAVKVVQNKSWTSWFAIDFGCALVKERVSRADGTVSEKTLVSLQSGEPGASLFAVQSSYTEAPPSALLVQPGETPRGGVIGADKEYWQYHSAPH